MLVKHIGDGDLDGVRTALSAGANPNEKDYRGKTALVLASSTDQYRIANLLINNGADIFESDQFGLSPGILASQSRLIGESPEGEALKIFVAELKSRGHPWPPPGPTEVLRLKSVGRWPPPRPERQQ